MTARQVLTSHLAAAALLSTLGACGGDASPTTPSNPPPTQTPGITLTLSVDSVTVFQGDSITVLATVTRTGGFSGNVTLGITGAPANVNATAGVIGSGSSAVIRIAATSSASQVVSTLNVSASGNGVPTATRTLRVSVEPFVLGLAQVGGTLVGLTAGDAFGSAVDISDDGTRIVVAAPNYSNSTAQAGLVRLFEWNGSAWGQVGVDIEGSGPAPGFHWRIGTEHALAISGDGRRVAIGGPKPDPFGFQANTAVVVFDVTGGWSQMGSPQSGAGSIGWSVDLSTDGQRLAAGVPGNSTFPNGTSGLFEFSGNDWQLVAGYLPPEDGSDEPGAAIALSGDGTRMAVAGPGNDGPAMDAGHVRIWDWNGSAWILSGEIDGDAVPGGRFGESISMSRDGQRIAVAAAPGNYVRVFEWSGSAWTPMGVRFEVEAGPNAENVALSGDGSRLAIGYPDEGNGMIRAFEWSGSAWVQLFAEVGAPSGTSQFGKTVAMNGDGSRVVAGSPASGAGSVRVYEIPDQP